MDGEPVPDTDYAQLTLAMRAGDDPGVVFDALHAHGQLVLHGSEIDRRDRLAAAIAAAVAAARSAGSEGVRTAVVVDTREHAAALNTAIRDRLIATGIVDDHRVAMTKNGQRVGAGDQVVTRRNDPQLGVDNRESWTVTRVHRDGSITITDNTNIADGATRGTRELPGDYVGEHVELGYAVTGYGAQGDTTPTAHLVLTETTTAATAYVAITRGRQTNTAHLVAESLADAREQWISAFSRDRADLGPTAASEAASRAAAGYTTPRPLAQVVAELWQAWDQQADAHRVLERLRPILDRALAAQPRVVADQAAEQAARDAAEQARRELSEAQHRLAAIEQDIDRDADRLAARLREAWDARRLEAQRDAQLIEAGAGRFGRGRAEISDATTRLEHWAAD